VDEAGHASRGIGKKEWLIIGGAGASIIALVFLMRRSGGTSTLMPSRAPVGGSGGGSNQDAITAANLKLQERKLEQDAAIAFATLELQKFAIGTQYSIAAKQADSSTAKTAIGAAGSALSAGGGLTELIKDLFKGKVTPGTAAPPGYGNSPSTPNYLGWDRLVQLWTGLQNQNSFFASLVNDANPNTTDTFTQYGVTHEPNYSNTLPYDNFPAGSSSEIIYGSPEAGTLDGGGEGEGMGLGWGGF